MGTFDNLFSPTATTTAKPTTQSGGTFANLFTPTATQTFANPNVPKLPPSTSPFNPNTPGNAEFNTQLDIKSGSQNNSFQNFFSAISNTFSKENIKTTGKQIAGIDSPNSPIQADTFMKGASIPLSLPGIAADVVTKAVSAPITITKNNLGFKDIVDVYKKAPNLTDIITDIVSGQSLPDKTQAVNPTMAGIGGFTGELARQALGAYLLSSLGDALSTKKGTIDVSPAQVKEVLADPNVQMPEPVKAELAKYSETGFKLDRNVPAGGARQTIGEVLGGSPQKGYEITPGENVANPGVKPTPVELPKFANPGITPYKAQLMKYPQARMTANLFNMAKGGFNALTTPKSAPETAITGKVGNIKISELNTLNDEGFRNIVPLDKSVTTGPIEIVKTDQGNVVVDGHHRVSEAIKAGKDTIDYKVLTPQEAIEKYGDVIPNLRKLIYPLDPIFVTDPKTQIAKVYPVKPLSTPTEKPAIAPVKYGAEDFGSYDSKTNSHITTPDTIARNHEVPLESISKTTLPISKLKLEEGVITGKELNPNNRVLAEQSPPIVRLTKDGEYKVLDGNHRVSQAIKEGYKQTPVWLIDESVGGNKTSGVAESINAKAIEQGMTDKGFQDLAEFNGTSFKEQADLMAKANVDDLKKIVRGEIPMPSEYRSAAVLSTLEDLAKKTGDAELMRDLANSPLATKISEGASETSLARMREKDSATMKLQEIKKAREAKAEARISKETRKVAKTAKAETEKVNLPKEDLEWEKFLTEIQC